MKRKGFPCFAASPTPLGLLAAPYWKALVTVFSPRDLSEPEGLGKQLSGSFTHDDIVGRHPKIQEIHSLLQANNGTTR